MSADRAGATISVRPDAEYLSTRDLAALLGLRNLRALRERLHRLRVPYIGPRARPRWRVEAVRLVFGR